jgi:hypothetical protein
MIQTIKDYENYAIDPSSGGVTNTNLKEYKAYKKKKEALLNSAKKQSMLSNKVDSLESDINSIKSDIDDIKNLLNSIVSKL